MSFESVQHCKQCDAGDVREFEGTPSMDAQVAF